MTSFAAILSVAMLGQTTVLRYWVETDLPGYSVADVFNITAEAAQAWMSVADVTIIPAARQADANLRVVPGNGIGWVGLTEVGGPHFYKQGQVAKLRLAKNHRHTRQGLLSVVEHEMGHALGLQHGPGVMAPTSTGVTQFSQNDIARVTRIYGLRRWVAVTPIPTPIETVEVYPVAPDLFPVAPPYSRGY